MAPDPLFTAEGRLSELDVLTLTDELGPGAVKGAHGDLSLPLREVSHFSIGDPIVLPLASASFGFASDSVPASELDAQRSQYEFHQVQLTCSFGAAPACRFTDARFEVRLEAVPTGGGAPSVAGPAGPATSDAIAYDLFPTLLEDATTVTITSAWKPDLSFNFSAASGTLSLPSWQRVEEEVRYTSRVEAFDLRGTRPAWSFRRTSQHEISGPQRLFMVVRKPVHTDVRATFSLHARVEFVIGGGGFSPAELVMLFRRRNVADTLTDEPSMVLC